MRLLPAPAVGLLLLTSMTGPGIRASEPWWSLQPLKTPATPELPAGERDWVRTPIDAFIRAKLRTRGLKPAPEADRRTLIRRLTFDLTGLPPTPEEVRAFAADPRPDAYERLVDRLLASPGYGERWARHWMDVARYAETHGHDQDRPRPNAWPYRDYLIGAFNADTPYPRFVREQLAADVLYSDEPRLLPALGFLAAGPWDESSLRDIREDSIDREVGRYLDRDEMVTAVSAAFLGLTVGCARCHDHKFDPIPQDEYYALQAVFAGVGRGVRKYDPDPAVARKRRELTADLAAAEKRRWSALARVDRPAFRKELAAWEAGRAVVRWEPLVPEAVTSAGGATLTPSPDHSVRSEGKRPDRDTYTVTARTRLKGVTAVRLELLTDDALPHRGPGRQDNGNLHLSEFRLAVGGKPVALQNPTSDFDQQGWTVKHALDGNPKTAWGIYPEVGKPHEAVFELAQPAGDGSEVELTVTLDQLHGGGHLLGRFRLSATTAAPPVKTAAIPARVAAALAVEPDRRATGHWREVGLYVLREKLTAALAALPPQQAVYVAARDFEPDASHKPTPQPRSVRMLKRGDIRKPGDEADPGALACVPARFTLENSADEGARRAALAAWLTDRDNPLPWRVIVNRVWHHHFGKGIVDTPNDLGRMGGLPTHPELLDWLAAEFRDNGASLKKLHRLIVTSAVYRQSSRHDPGFARVDADNRFLWRMTRSRLDAEQVRDAVLQVSGRLDRKAGGPSDQQFAMKPGIHVTPIVEYGGFDWGRPQRRSVYRFVFRTLPDPLVECLDGADASQPTAVRNTSVTAPQALSLLNNEFVVAQAKAMAEDLAKQTTDRVKQIEMACERVWGRGPTAEERAAFAAYAGKHGTAALCRVLFNTNEFLFVD